MKIYNRLKSFFSCQTSFGGVKETSRVNETRLLRTKSICYVKTVIKIDVE